MFPIDASPVLGRDPAFMESISKTMRVPERLSVGPGPDQDQDQHQTKPPVYSMQVPDRLTYAAAELSPRPQFGPKSRLEVCVESPQEIHRDQQQSPIRRSMSDQCFARTPPGTPPGTPHRAMVLPRPQGTSRRLVDLPPVSPSTSSLPPPSAHSLLQMTLQASARLLQAASRKCLGTEPPQTPLRAETVPVQSDSRRTESWVAEDEGGAAVELIVLRRQVSVPHRPHPQGEGESPTGLSLRGEGESPTGLTLRVRESPPQASPSGPHPQGEGESPTGVSPTGLTLRVRESPPQASPSGSHPQGEGESPTGLTLRVRESPPQASPSGVRESPPQECPPQASPSALKLLPLVKPKLEPTGDQEETGRRPGGDREETGRRPGGDREETGRRPGGDWEETGRRLGGDREETRTQRTVLKMSRRLAALERHNCERQNTELVLFCLLGSACLLNAWLWIRR
uniref:Mff-like domain-containing protein n=1 Tax=Knipowitschia caucasica TaxID=637954 RepID=A0AAV2JGK3_KNICA